MKSRPYVPDRRSEEAAEYRKLYKLKRWQDIRAAHLRENPLCVRCLERGIINDGSRTMDGAPQENPHRRFLVVDHVEPHRGDLFKFWHGRRQTLCPDHHDIVKQSEEGRGYSVETSADDGWPIDPRHPANN